MLRGVELYRGKPICYSLGNFIFTLETISAFPIEVYEQQGMPSTATTSDFYDRVTGYATESRFWESVIARFEFDDGSLTKSEFVPVTLGGELVRSQRGCPSIAIGSDGESILARLSELSKPFGTDLHIKRTGDRVAASFDK
jgi:poly-gamma-glutamate synthesis protein (capsule biosynthesis protein)